MIRKNQMPTSLELEEAFQNAQYVVVVNELSFDHETVISLLGRFKDDEAVFLLESATSGPSHMARYSYLGLDPLIEFRWSLEFKDRLYVETKLRRNRQSAFPKSSGSTKSASITEEIVIDSKSNPLRKVGDYFKDLTHQVLFMEGVGSSRPAAPVFFNLSGYCGFDTTAVLEPSTGSPPPKILGLPDLSLMVPGTFLVLDNLSRKLFVAVVCPRPVLLANLDEVSLASSLEALEDSIKNLWQRLDQNYQPEKFDVVKATPRFGDCKASLDQQTFEQLAERCLGYVSEGEVFQIQIGTRMAASTESSAFNIFRHLRMLNPSPYMFFFKIGADHLLGASPELMVNVDGQEVIHRPIAGTRKRTWDEAYDARMITELTSSIKERAEHVMLVDLARNDISRVTKPGSVEVQELMMVERYSHVFHLVSQVRGSLRASLDAMDALIAGFPNGTVTGAPKVRAIQLIYQLEKASREFYAGSMMMFDGRFNLKSTLLIRTIHVRGDEAVTQASAGIVYDSLPAQEWLEICNKLSATLTVIQNTR